LDFNQSALEVQPRIASQLTEDSRLPVKLTTNYYVLSFQALRQFESSVAYILLNILFSVLFSVRSPITIALDWPENIEIVKHSKPDIVLLLWTDHLQLRKIRPDMAKIRRPISTHPQKRMAPP